MKWTEGGLGAVLQRDEGTVAILEANWDAGSMKVVGRYEDGIEDSFDGDLVFSNDSRWLFYARQTHQFSKDGIHVLDVSDPTQPRLAFYQPQGGTLRIAYFKQGSDEWVFTLDAIDGLVVNRFDPTTGALVPVHAWPLPALKVGGPASAGLYVEPRDPITKGPLLYVTTGRTGVEVFDIGDPSRPQLLGAWSDVGLADIVVIASKKERTIYAAHEYWFDKSLEPAVVVLDATDLGTIEKTATWSFGAPADDASRVQGLTFYTTGGRLDQLYVAYSKLGVLVVDGKGKVVDRIRLPGRGNERSAYPGERSIAYDVVLDPWERVLVTDAATGRLTRHEEWCEATISHTDQI